MNSRKTTLSLIIWCLTLPLVLIISAIVWNYLFYVVYADKFLGLLSASIITAPILFVGLIISCIGIIVSRKKVFKNNEKNKTITPTPEDEAFRRADDKAMDQTLKRLKEERELNGAENEDVSMADKQERQKTSKRG